MMRLDITPDEVEGVLNYIMQNSEVPEFRSRAWGLQFIFDYPDDKPELNVHEYLVWLHEFVVEQTEVLFREAMLSGMR